MDDYAAGRYIDLLQGCVTAEQPLHAHFLMPQNAGFFVELLCTGFDSMHALSLNRELRGVYLAILIEYYRLHIPDFPKLKSLDILKELFD